MRYPSPRSRNLDRRLDLPSNWKLVTDEPQQHMVQMTDVVRSVPRSCASSLVESLQQSVQ